MEDLSGNTSAKRPRVPDIPPRERADRERNSQQQRGALRSGDCSATSSEDTDCSGYRGTPVPRPPHLGAQLSVCSMAAAPSPASSAPAGSTSSGSYAGIAAQPVASSSTDDEEDNEGPLLARYLNPGPAGVVPKWVLTLMQVLNGTSKELGMRLLREMREAGVNDVPASMEEVVEGASSYGKVRLCGAVGRGNKGCKGAQAVGP